MEAETYSENKKLPSASLAIVQRIACSSRSCSLVSSKCSSTVSFASKVFQLVLSRQLLAVWMYVDRLSFLAQRRAELLNWSGKRTGPTLTSLSPPEVGRPSLYFSAHCCPSNGADTSSARTRGGSRPAELKVVTLTPENRDECHVGVVLRDG